MENLQGMTDEQLMALYKQKYPKGKPQEQTAQATAQSQPNIAALLQTITGKPTLGDRVQGGLKGMADAGAQIYGGVKPSESQSKLTDLFAQEAIKNQLNPEDRELKTARIKSLNAGITTDEDGNVIKTTDVARDEREKRMKQFEGRRQASTLRGELNQNQYVKRFQEMNSAARGIDTMLQDTLSRTDNQSKNVGDQALITLYNKILDPLSVVRESEYARTPEGQSLLNRIQGFVQKVQSGGSGLTDADRLEIGRAAKLLINQSGDMYNSKLDEYGNLADTYEVEPNMVIGGFERFTPYDIQQQIVNQVQPTQMVGAGAPQAPQAMPQQAPQEQSVGMPTVGGMFNGQKIKKVTKIG